MRLLIAEDDATSRVVLSGVLRKNGFEVIETVNGAEAWDVLQQAEAPSLVILDWMMPEMDGLEVTRRVRTLQTDRPPYIIMLTTKNDKADIITALDAGANDYLIKPFDPGELRARVEVGRRMVVLQDDLARSREIMAHQATHDLLTGMLNRRGVLERLNEELARASRGCYLLAVGLCDIDHFKAFNDTYGHQTGDEVLCGLAKILDESSRPFDAVGRMGGEEFLVVVPIETGMNYLAAFERLRAKVAESKVPTRSGPLSITVSIGVACATGESSVDRMLELADKSLYQAKNEGRNRVAQHESCRGD